MTGSQGFRHGTYLCSFHGGMFEAPAGSVDRTIEIRCPDCTAATPADIHDDDVYWYRLRWMVG